MSTAFGLVGNSEHYGLLLGTPLPPSGLVNSGLNEG